ncbi:MAG: hybrid sensor histidine kinase/response regulator [gamma proteobacterium symbiont of Bathyaustriella thionipta]|nr:hybrid sensor histidine kinase/response regulator [gamma proteobacterium symbiont of Bathyaustriella thionipta]
MRLRTQFFGFLLLFGLLPMLAVYLVIVPLVVDQLSLLYRDAHVQGLRADFRDLDEYIAGRKEILRLLGKFPEPGLLPTRLNNEELSKARADYTAWIARMLDNQHDIIQIIFLDEQGLEKFWLARQNTGNSWYPTAERPLKADNNFFAVVRHIPDGAVAVSSIAVDPDAAQEDQNHFMNLRLITPVYSKTSARHQGKPDGAVILVIDVGGLANVYKNTLWVLNDGRLLNPHASDKKQESAFERFPGLQDIFQHSELALWEGSQPILWVPMFRTEDNQLLWVGRRVDRSPIAKFRKIVEWRAIMIAVGVLLIMALLSRWIALRAERLIDRIKNGVGKVLQSAEPVEFNWQGPQEIQALGQDLSELSGKHSANLRSLRAHASELERSYRFKSEFLANVSHELKTPLNSILVLSKLMSDSSATEVSQDVKEQAAVINAAGEDLLNLINNILELSRAESGHAGLQAGEIYLHETLSDLLDLMRPQFEARGLTLSLRVTANVPGQILNDEEKLRQVIKNFLANAVKFTHVGGAEISVHFNPQLYSESSPLAICVKDTGIGISEDKQDIVFQAFQQADGATNRRYGGTGLGLAISRELAHLMGGRIQLQSVAGEGSCFCLLLPLDASAGNPLESDTRADPGQLSDKSEETLMEANFSGHRIMIIDNDLRRLLQITTLLESWGLEIMAAADIQEAMDTLDGDSNFSLLLCSIRMSGAGVCDTISRVRQIAGMQQVTVIALTEDDSEASRIAALESGADDFIVSNARPQALAELIERHLPSS